MAARVDSAGSMVQRRASLPGDAAAGRSPGQPRPSASRPGQGGGPAGSVSPSGSPPAEAARPPEPAKGSAGEPSAPALGPPALPSVTDHAAWLERLRAQAALDPVSEHPELYSAQAKADLKARIAAQGADFRTSSAEREEFKQAFLAHVGRARLTHGNLNTPQKVYESYAADVEKIKRTHPEVAHIPTEDLVALRAWTSAHYEVVQDALDGDKVPPNPLGLSYAKAIISALNALPESFIYRGTVYTGEDQSPQWVRERHAVGATATDWRFFATAQTREGAWQGRNVEWETLSHQGKCIALFSHHEHEKEVLFPPGTRFQTTDIDAIGTVTRADGRTEPLFKIRQQQVL